jgi:arylsulfatase A-like enzyme
MTGPDVKKGRRVSNLVSLIDLCPTFIEMSGLPERQGLSGDSLLPLATGEAKESRGWAYASFTGCSLNTVSFLLRRGRWKYIVYVGCDPQLFDLKDDPAELNDLSGERPEVVAELDAELRRIVDYDQTYRDWIAYCKKSFREWRRQALRGVHVDAGYSLRDDPSSDYWAIMNN